MILDNSWILSAAQAMPNGTTAISTNTIDWTSSKWKDWINSPQPIWVVSTIHYTTADPPVGTSIKAEAWQHTSATVTSGDLLGEGPIIALADISNKPDNDGHILWVVPLLTLMAAAQAMGGQDQYFGIVYRAVGDMSKGTINTYLHMGVNPPVAVTRPTASNIVMPT